MTTVVINQTGPTIVQVVNNRALKVSVVNKSRIVVISKNGGVSPVQEETRQAETSISALRLVSDHAAGVRYTDLSDDASVAAVLGVAITAAAPGGTVRIKTSPGEHIDDNSWAWTPGFVFAGPNGTLTQIVPASGWEIVVGYAPSPTRLNLTFDEPLKLA